MDWLSSSLTPNHHDKLTRLFFSCYLLSWITASTLGPAAGVLFFSPDLFPELQISISNGPCSSGFLVSARGCSMPAGLTCHSYLGILGCLPRLSEPCEQDEETEAQKQNMGIFLHLRVRILAWLFQKLKVISVLVLMGSEDTWKVYMRLKYKAECQCINWHWKKYTILINWTIVLYIGGQTILRR